MKTDNNKEIAINCSLAFFSFIGFPFLWIILYLLPKMNYVPKKISDFNVNYIKIY